MSKIYDLVIVGAGPGGYEAAFHAAQHHKKSVLLIDKNALGGTCLNVGCIPTKTFLKSAKLFRESKKAEEYGVSNGFPTFRMDLLQDKKNKVVKQLVSGIQGRLKQLQIDTIQGEASFAKNGQLQLNGSEIQYKNLLLATGASPVLPPIPGIEGSQVLSSTTALDLDLKPLSIVIVGAGVIGLEFASFFADVECKVHVVDILPAIASGSDSSLSTLLQADLKKRGVHFHLKSKVKTIGEQTVEIETEDGQTKKLDAEKVLIATGRKPNYASLNIQNANIKAGPKGIVTDVFGRTSNDSIYACGDVCGKSQLAHAATREGIVAVNHMSGLEEDINYLAIPKVIYTYPELAWLGKTEEQVKSEKIDYKKVELSMNFSGRYLLETPGGRGKIKLLLDEKNILLGVHIFGDPAGEIIHAVSYIFENKIPYDKLSTTVFAHPTVSEIFKESLNQLS